MNISFPLAASANTEFFEIKNGYSFIRIFTIGCITVAAFSMLYQSLYSKKTEIVILKKTSLKLSEKSKNAKIAEQRTLRFIKRVHNKRLFFCTKSGDTEGVLATLERMRIEQVITPDEYDKKKYSIYSKNQVFL